MQDTSGSFLTDLAHEREKTGFFLGWPCSFDILEVEAPAASGVIIRQSALYSTHDLSKTYEFVKNLIFS